MLERKSILLAAIVFLLTSSVIAFASEIRVNGGGAAINTVFRPIASHAAKEAGITLSILQNTPKNGLADLVQGRADIATAAVPLESMIIGVQKDGIDIDQSTLRQTVIAKNRTVVFLHKDNPVRKLSKEQLKSIFTGKVMNWKEVGGKDMPVVVVWGKTSPGQNALFTKEILDGDAVTTEVLDATDYANIKETVAANPESIGIDPLGLADASVNVPDTPEVSSSIIMVTRGEPSPAVQKLIDYINGEGRKYIKQ